MTAEKLIEKAHNLGLGICHHAGDVYSIKDVETGELIFTCFSMDEIRGFIQGIAWERAPQG